MEKDYMSKKIDTSAEDYAREAERLRSERELQRLQEMMIKNDTSAEDYAREAERLRSERELQRLQEMMYQYNDDSNYIEKTGRHR